MKGQNTQTEKTRLEEMFAVGAHFGFSRARRHPSVRRFIFGAKNKTEIINLEETAKQLDAACTFVENLAKEGKKILFVGTKSEARDIVRSAAEHIGMPYVTNRWVGGTFTNFSEIKKRISRLKDLTERKEKEGFQGYTKKERLLIDREIDRLREAFGGIADVTEAPQAMFILDIRHEKNAFEEAKAMNIPVVSLSSSDCDIQNVAYPVLANDTSVASVKYFTDRIASAYEEGKKHAPVAKAPDTHPLS